MVDQKHVHGRESLVWMENISKKFGQFAALDNVSLKIPSGELVVSFDIPARSNSASA